MKIENFEKIDKQLNTLKRIVNAVERREKEKIKENWKELTVRELENDLFDYFNGWDKKVVIQELLANLTLEEKVDYQIDYKEMITESEQLKHNN